MPQSSMVNLRGAHRPSISYRPIRLSDLEVVEKLHGDLFPIRYESEFFLNVVNGRDIVSWGAVDRNRPNGQSDELIGFVTARIVMAKESEIEDMLRFETARVDQTLVYILTLGVVGSYRNLGIATSLIREIIKYSSNIQTCQAVYLHVISYNNSAIHLYKKMSFQCVRRLHEFYFINGQHYDSYLFVLYVNGGRSPCSPLELVTILVAYIRSGFKLVASRLWRKKERKVPRWLKYTEKGGGGLLPMTQNKRIVTTEVTGSHKITYHNGPILTGEINLSILWYGKVKEQQKSQLRLFISSLNTGKNVTLEPRVIDWWRMVESYQLLADKKLQRSAPKITVNLVKEVDDDHPTPTNLRDADFKDVVNKLVAGDNGKTIAVIVLGEKVEWESARSRCFMHNFDGKIHFD